MAKVSTAYTFNKSNSNISYCYYNSGWSSWKTTKLNGGYAGDSTNYKYCVALKFTAPEFKGITENFKITIPYCRSANTDTQAADGTLKLKLTTTDPRTGNLSEALANCNITADWSARNSSGYKDKKMHTVDVTFTDALKANTDYYIVIGTVDLKNNNDWIEIGEYTEEDKLWQATLNTYYEEVTANKPTITDNKNNTFTIGANAGTPGAGNSVKSTTLYYRQGSSGSYTQADSLNLPATYITCGPSVASQPIYAYTYVDGEYNDATSELAAASVKNYQAPTWPVDAKVELVASSFKNGRLTIKQNWGWQWTAARATNASSAVAGYEIRFAVIYDNGTTLSKNYSTSAGLTILYTNYDVVNPAIKPNDKIRLSIRAFAYDGTGSKLYTDWIASEIYTIQNAGVVNVKVNNVWHEGQVWVKANDEWHEAETVNARVDSWRESQ